MNRGIVIDQYAVERLCFDLSPRDSWLDEAKAGAPIDGVHQVEVAGFLYLVSPTAKLNSQLLVIATDDGSNFFKLAERDRVECFQRILRVVQSRFSGGEVKIPLDWRLFHSSCLLSFQSNRRSSGVKDRVYIDLNPEGTDHAFVFALVGDQRTTLSKASYSADAFQDAVLYLDEALALAVDSGVQVDSGQFSVALTRSFASAEVAQGLPFSAWRDSKLTSDQLRFFNAPFHGPLRLRGAAGTGKTIVLCLRFLKEVYERVDSGEPFRAAFVTHGQETADNIKNYLIHIDERGILPGLSGDGVIDVNTLHGLANFFVNIDAESVQPISLDGSEGRILQLELLTAICVGTRRRIDSVALDNESAVVSGLTSDIGSGQFIGFLCDLIDEFSTVLESYGLRDVDLIAERYLKAPFAGRLLARSTEDRQLILDVYREFRRQLLDMGIVSLDQFIADFIAYLNSFRWDAVRGKRGFDFVFADELHLFNRQERQVFGYLMRDASGPMLVALAYDPRQSPRSAFLPEDQVSKDSVWSEARLALGGQRFELKEVFRYTPEILAFLKRLNRHFPAEDLSEEWGLEFGSSMLPHGAKPTAEDFSTQLEMVKRVTDEARKLMRRNQGKVAVLCLDPERFSHYLKVGMFQSAFVSVASRDDISSIQRFAQRAVLSMPEHVAGLQFDHVFLLDANATLIARLGSGLNGMQRFISNVYLGASRAKSSLKVFADRSEGGFAGPIRDAIEGKQLVQS